jgi:hypothetical protein
MRISVQSPPLLMTIDRKQPEQITNNTKRTREILNPRLRQHKLRSTRRISSPAKELILTWICLTRGYYI